MLGSRKANEERSGRSNFCSNISVSISLHKLRVSSSGALHKLFARKFSGQVLCKSLRYFSVTVGASSAHVSLSKVCQGLCDFFLRALAGFSQVHSTSSEQFPFSSHFSLKASASDSEQPFAMFCGKSVQTERKKHGLNSLRATLEATDLVERTGISSPPIQLSFGR